MSATDIGEAGKPAPLITELGTVQNPAFCAYSIWQYGLGYQSLAQKPSPIPLIFLVLPLLLHRPTLQLIIATQRRSGLTVLAAKIAENREDLLAIHERARALRMLSLRSIGYAASTGLATIGYADAIMWAHPLEKKQKKPLMPERIKDFPGAAEKIGIWFATMSLSQISSILRVNF